MTSDSAVLSCHRRGAVLEVCLADPERSNALSVQMAAELRSAFSDLTGVGAVVVSSVGRHFCAGGDHREITRLTADEMRSYRAHLGAVFAALDSCPVPVIVAVRGGAVGGGVELAVRADFIVAEPSAVFSLPQVAMGIGVSSTAASVIAARCGVGFARRMVLRGERITAGEALAHGLIDELTAELRSTEEAVAIATELAQLPRAAVARARATLRSVIAHSNMARRDSI